MALSGVRIADNSPDHVTIVATFCTAQGEPSTLEYELKLGQVFVQTQPCAGVTGLQVLAPCRFAVLPDFFGDDIVVDASTIPVPRAELPSENFLLHMLPGQDAVLMTVSSQRGRDAQIALSGQGEQRRVDHSVMDYGPKGKIWMAVLGGRNVWHQRDVLGEHAGQIGQGRNA